MKNGNENQPIIQSSPPTLPCPAISIIIAMYNAEKYIGECLESVLNQTFQNFEVIVVDDCSTDNSVEIVKKYAPKFNGRLTLTQTETNSGGCALPRNKAVMFSRGEYLQCLDADDMLTDTALEELYTLAKDYDADVVYCEKHYLADADGTNTRIKVFQKGDLVTEPTLETADFAERVDKILKDLFVVSTCFKFVRRKLMVENGLFFPHIAPAEDDIWTYGLIFCAKKFLRVPNAVYIRRLSENSTMRRERTPQQKINFWLNPVLLGLKSLDNFMNQHEFFKTNPSYRYDLLKMFIDPKINRTVDAASEFTEDIIYSMIKDEFGEKLNEYDVLIPALCATLYKEKKNYFDEKKAHGEDSQIIRSLAPYLTARMDIKLTSKADDGDFQIISVSDEKARIAKPEWLNEGNIGYSIYSYFGKLEIVAKSNVDAQIQFTLRGSDIRDPADNSKRIPCWIDYTSFVINGRTIFDVSTPTWHDKPYRYGMEVKADEEITLQVEWLPHRIDAKKIEELAYYQPSIRKEKSAEEKVGEENAFIFEKKVDTEIKKVDNVQKLQSEQLSLTQSLNPDLQQQLPQVENAYVQKPESKRHDDKHAQTIQNSPLYLTARIDLKLIPKDGSGDFQILSLSDDEAKVSKIGSLNKDGISYAITSYAGNLKIIAKAITSGQVQIRLRGRDVRDPKNKSKRIPHWIDYTALVVNGQTILDTLTPTWHNKPYQYNMEVKADEEITLQVEWLPHKSDT